jgi:putative MFS transporter
MTFIFSLARIPGVFLAGFIMDKMDRTKLLTVSLVLTAASLASFALMTLFTENAWLIVLSACPFHCCLVVTWSVLSVVTAEIFPTTVRATAMGVCASSGRGASVLVHLISAPIVEYHNPSVLLFLGAGSFALGIITSIITSIQSRTGQPLQDLENPLANRSNLAPIKNADSSDR